MVDLTKAEPVSGAVSLTKGGPTVVLIKDTRNVEATVSWRSGTDYDVYGLVLLKDGSSRSVATFRARGVPACDYYNGVRHLGDVTAADARRREEVTETLSIVMDESIVAVVPVVYSARNNGTGSFHRYKVSLAVDDGRGTRVEVPADQANNDDRVYTCVPGIIYNTPDGVVVERRELYSKHNSEYRPVVKLDRRGNVEIIMDQGPENLAK